MKFGEKLKTLRKQAGLSQEKLAEKLCVSRQAVTKWETGAGIPDIENVKAIAALFGESLDELLSEEKPAVKQVDFLYESVTEYDIDRPKRYDMNFGSAKAIVLSGHDGEKIKVRLASNEIAALQSDLKVKIDDSKDRIDIDISRKNGILESTVKSSLFIFAMIPNKYSGHIELAAGAESVELRNISCEKTELSIKSGKLTIDGVTGTVETDCNLDMEIFCKTMNGSVELNQINAVSKIYVPADSEFIAYAKGLKTRISYGGGEDFSTAGAKRHIELNGMKSELIIYKNL